MKTYYELMANLSFVAGIVISALRLTDVVHGQAGNYVLLVLILWLSAGVFAAAGEDL